MKRELIYMDAKSSKFWNIELAGSSHTVTYGRIGSAGQSATKSFPSDEAARKDYDKLVKEKLGKGYVDNAPAEAGGAGDDTTIPLVAFSSINHRDEISSNAGTFIGKRVHDYDPEKPARSDIVYRFKSDYEDDNLLAHLEHFMATPAALKANALIIGCWQGDESDRSPGEVIAALVAGREKLPKLAAIYLGDITSEENEMSWIYQSDVSPLLEAFPHLQLLRTRGGQELSLTKPQHAHLRGLAMETGGMDASVVKSISKSEFPNLEYLELWLGTPEYGGNVTAENLQPILSGKLFPNLKYLGLRNSEIADELAAVLVNSPLVQRLETLDLSLGTLSDEGGHSLLKLASPTLKKLNLHYNYMSAGMIKKLKAHSFTVDASRPEMDLEEEDRFVAVGE